MQTLHTLVRNLAIILLLATFLEMLLPNKSMRGFVQMVMGLFVISAVLAPVTSFLHTPLEMDIPAWAVTTPQDLPAIAAEGQGVKLGRDAVQGQYRQILTHQIQALALSTNGVSAATVDIQFEEETGGVTDQPKIKEVSVSLTSTKGDVKTVQPITITIEQSSAAAKTYSSKAEEVREKISTFMNLSKELILVQES
ncbi:MAG: stage III sporulation protein AF [Bacillota bacterium]|nr:stage III sporulation protein AF [Bacillota bacterium]